MGSEYRVVPFSSSPCNQTILSPCSPPIEGEAGGIGVQVALLTYFGEALVTERISLVLPQPTGDINRSTDQPINRSDITDSVHTQRPAPLSCRILNSFD